MAEKLVENPEAINAFKFDTVNPNSVNENQNKQRSAINMGKLPFSQNVFSSIFILIVFLENKIVERNPKAEYNKDSSSSDDNGGFVRPPPGDNISKRSQVKRATIVGNPMFSNSADNELATGESLGLDDLDMDYEQIMHYFDNLKVGKL